MKAVCAADVPAVCTMLFCQRSYRRRAIRLRITKPKKAETIETFGPKPSFSTMYG